MLKPVADGSWFQAEEAVSKIIRVGAVLAMAIVGKWVHGFGARLALAAEEAVRGFVAGRAADAFPASGGFEFQESL